MPNDADVLPPAGMIDVGTAEETVYTCLRHLAEDGIRDGLNKPGAPRIVVSQTPTGEVAYINRCQHRVEQDLVKVETSSGWPTENAWNALKLALNIDGFECPEGGRAKELREIAKKVGVIRVTHLTPSEAEDFSRELHADLADPEWSARKKLMDDLGVWKDKHTRFSMRYTPDTKEAKSFTSRWLPRVFVRVLLWLSALETCIRDKTAPCNKGTVQNAARRVLSRWYRWFAADGLKDRVPPFTLGNETGGARGEKRGASLSVDGLGETARGGQDAKKRQTGTAAPKVLPFVPLPGGMLALPFTEGKEARVSDLAASAGVSADSWHDGMSVQHEGAGEFEDEDEMAGILEILPALPPSP